MMAGDVNPTGSLTLHVNGEPVTLWLGMSVLADLQEKHGQDVLARLDPPPGAGPGWMPPLQIVVDLIVGALQRNHPDRADRWFVDDLLAQNAGGFEKLMAAAFPDAPKAAPGNGQRRTVKRA
jgi:hypothetical protein